MLHSPYLHHKHSHRYLFVLFFSSIPPTSSDTRPWYFRFFLFLSAHHPWEEKPASIYCKTWHQIKCERSDNLNTCLVWIQALFESWDCSIIEQGLPLRKINNNPRYHQRRCLETWPINSTHAPLNRDDGGLSPEAYLHHRSFEGINMDPIFTTITPDEDTRLEWLFKLLQKLLKPE